MRLWHCYNCEDCWKIIIIFIAIKEAYLEDKMQNSLSKLPQGQKSNKTSIIDKLLNLKKSISGDVSN